ncbi:MAG: hypothetical protein WB780_06620 [Candidatus Acidiferrales bacterium]
MKVLCFARHPPGRPPVPLSPNLDKAWQVNTEKILAGIEKLAAY